MSEMNRKRLQSIYSQIADLELACEKIDVCLTGKRVYSGLKELGLASENDVQNQEKKIEEIKKDLRKSASRILNLAK